MIKDNPDKVSWWNSNYNIKEKIDFLRYRILSPCDKEKPDNYLEIGKTSISEREPNFHLTFLGDLMPLGKYRMKISPPLQALLNSSDAVVVNLEGVITTRKRFLAQSHKHSIIDCIKTYLPKTTILNLANNHAADFGSSEFASQLALLQKNNVLYFGHDKNGFNLKDCIHLYSSTFWTNQPLKVVESFKYEDHLPLNLNEKKSMYTVFLPHWGYEMHLYPTQIQREFAYKMLHSSWDCIIGNHSHSPQPVERIGNNIIAYSLGNFCYNNSNPNHSYGRVLKLGFTLKPNERPILENATNYLINQQIKDESITIDFADRLDYKSVRKNIKLNSKYLFDLLK